MKVGMIAFLATGLIGFTQSIGGSEQTVAVGTVPRYPARPPVVQPMFQRYNFSGPLLASTGKFVYMMTISVKSAIPSGDVISCVGTAEVSDVSTGRVIEETAGVAATRSGSSASCTVTIPYSWALGSAGSDHVLLGFDIVTPATAVGAPLPSRSSIQQFATISVPANGSTTTEVITPTI